MTVTGFPQRRQGITFLAACAGALSLASQCGQTTEIGMGGYHENEERQRRAAPKSPAKGASERTLAAAPRTGSVAQSTASEVS